MVTALFTSPVAQMLKNLPAIQETRVPVLGGKIPWRKEWQPTPVFLPEEFYGERSLAGYSPWGHKESDMTEHTRTIIYLLGIVFQLNITRNQSLWLVHLQS